MRRDSFLLHHPAQHRCGAVGGIPDEALRGEVETFLDPFDHGLGGFDFRRPVGRRRFHIKDHPMRHIDEVMRGVQERRPARRAPPSIGIADRSGKCA